MDPYDERRLINEVIYLHSLWHQGPPQLQNPQPATRAFSSNMHTGILTQQPNPTATFSSNPRMDILPPQPNPTVSSNLHVSNTAIFKKPKKKKKNKKLQKPTLPLDSGIEWPCSQPIDKNPQQDAGWPQPSSPPAVKPLSIEQGAKLTTFKMQKAVLQLCREFYAKRSSENDDMEEDESEDEVDVQECAEYKFFMQLFVKNNELRNYYEKNFESADFSCLVCGGLSEISEKRFKSCAALAQHCAKILKKNKQAHRALGQVICRVLGWDFDRLPTIVSKDEPLSQSLLNPGESMVEPKVNDEGKKQELPASSCDADFVDGGYGKPAAGDYSNAHEKNDLVAEAYGTVFVNTIDSELVSGDCSNAHGKKELVAGASVTAFVNSVDGYRVAGDYSNAPEKKELVAHPSDTVFLDTVDSESVAGERSSAREKKEVVTSASDAEFVKTGDGETVAGNCSIADEKKELQSGPCVAEFVNTGDGESVAGNCSNADEKKELPSGACVAEFVNSGDGESVAGNRSNTDEKKELPSGVSIVEFVNTGDGESVARDSSNPQSKNEPVVHEVGYCENTNS